MKIAVIVVRILLGLIFVMSAIVVLFKIVPQPEMKGAVGTFMKGMEASVYLMTLIKVTELVCGILLISGFFVPLATVVLFPISLNILLFHAFLAPEGLIMSVLIFLGNVFLAYAYRKRYEPMLAPK
jgi:putative oxidoreductase